MSQFHCIHCGSAREPLSKADTWDYHNTQLAGMLGLLSLLTCGLFLPFAFLIYHFKASRKHWCRDCGIKLGG